MAKDLDLDVKSTLAS